MKNGDINDFLERITWGDELVFMYRGKKYFLEGLPDDNGVLITYLWVCEPPAYGGYTWVGKGDKKNYPAEEFLRQKLWDGRTFMEAQEEMEWAGIPVLDNWIPESVASYLLFGGNFTGNVRS